MTHDSSPQNGTRASAVRWLIPAAVGAAVIVALLVFAVWWAIGGTNAFGPRAVGDLLASSHDLHPVEATDELSAGIRPAWRVGEPTWART